ncbi:MAG TPA: DJ-1/PfpI family protein [Candidatus Binatia bacterium]|nr:DJ-1/PfpI family protein [Candidatus Binatia bacterium]
MTHVLIIAGDFTSSGQLQYSYYRMKEEDFDVTIAALEKKRLNTVIDMREEAWELDTERRGYSFQSDMTFDEVDPSTFDALILPGWRAVEYLRNNQRCVEIVRHFVEAGKPIAAIDQAPRLLIAAGVRGRRMTGIDMIKSEIARANTYVEAGSEPVVDGNIVTVSRRPYYDVWMRAFMSMLRERRLVGV